MVIRLIIEGSTDTTNGDLRKGFSKLLEQILIGSMPRIIMGEGKTQAIDKFKNAKDAILLCDLDGPASSRGQDLEKYHFKQNRDSVYYMIQEMESWILSQPKIIDNFYNEEISKRIPHKHPSEIDKPDELLLRLTKNCKKGSYHKVKHGVALLQMLNAEELMKNFPDFNRLISTLKLSNQ